MGISIRCIHTTIGFLVLLSGCSISPGVLLAVSAPIPTPIAVYPSPPENTRNAIIDLIVPDVELAANQAEGLTHQYRSRIVNSSAWYENHQHVLMMEILVPVDHFINLHQSLLGLGQVVADEASYNTVPDSRINPFDIGRITLILRSDQPKIQPVFPLARQSWDPLATFKRASSVFMKIFGFLVDILIWAVVVAGPFIFIAFGAWWLARHFHRRKSTNP